MLRIGKTRFYDLLHKGAVIGCMTGSAVAILNLGAIFYRLFAKNDTKGTGSGIPTDGVHLEEKVQQS